MKLSKLVCAAAAVWLLLCGCTVPAVLSEPPYIDLDIIPAWDGEPWLIVDDNTPGFTEDDLTRLPFAHYSALDLLGRSGSASACVSVSTLADEERDPISHITPTGFVNRKYDFIDGDYLYNRCHLLGFQLTESPANERNLVTGTRYMNIQGMLPYENRLAEHVRENRHHVLYRVTPRFRDMELVCRGVQMEAYCVECGNDDPFMFHVFCYNVQPGVQIDYRTGLSTRSEIGQGSEEMTCILNISSKKFHLSGCPSVATMSEKNREEIESTREELIYRGYDPCGVCKP